MNKDFIKIVWKKSPLPVWMFAMIHSNCKDTEGKHAFTNGYGGTDYWGKERRSFYCEKHEVYVEYRQ